MSSIKSSAKPISQDQLAAELAKSAPRQAAPAAEPAAEQQSERTVADEQKQHVKTSPSVMDALNKSMSEKAKKPDAAKGEQKADDFEPAAEPKAEPAKADAAKEPAKKKEAVSAEDAPPPGKATDTAITEEEKGVMPHDSARVRARITYLNNEAKKAAAEAAAAKKELEEARKAPPSAASAEEVARLKEEHQKLQDEATRLRRRYDWENDGETKAKYREPVIAAEKTIEDAFKRNNFAEPTLKAIKDAGGFAAFSRSKATYPVTVTENGEEKTVQYTAAELARSWLSRMPIADAQLINQSVGRQEDLKVQESTAREKAEAEAKAYFESQTAAQRQAQEQAQANTKKQTEEYEAWAKSTESETDWLKDADIPANASEDEKKAVADRNAFAAELRAQLKTHPTTPKEYGQLKLDAARAKLLERSMAEKDAEIERLNAELKKKAAAGRTTPKSGSLLRGDPKPTEEKAKPGDTNVMGAIQRRMQAKMAGDDE